MLNMTHINIIIFKEKSYTISEVDKYALITCYV